jgi:hypothetical protein
MTQEQQIIIWEYLDKNLDNGEENVNAMWLAEEMWEQHCAIMQAKMSGSGSKYVIEKRTWQMNFCMSLMEYIWLPHDVIKDIALYSNQPERFEYSYNSFEGNWMVKAISITCNDEGHDREVYCVITRHAEEMPMMALALILNHANKAGHDAVTRLSA